jgi:hypothetical protein
VIPEDLLLLRLRGAVGPVPPRLADRIPSECRQCELGVIPQVEPPLPASVRVGHGRWDVVVAPALLHPEIGAHDRHRLGTILQAREHKEILEEVPMGTNSQVPHAHRLKRRLLLDVVRVELLQLEAVLEEDSTNEPPGGDGEAALVEGHERDHEPLGGAAQTCHRAPSTPRRR